MYVPLTHHPFSLHGSLMTHDRELLLCRTVQDDSLTPFADVSKVMSIDDTEGIGRFFDGFAVAQAHNGTL